VASCDLTIELEGDGVYRPGQTIKGTLHVSTSGAVRCDSLFVSLDWYTHGRGNRVRGAIERSELFVGELTAGEHRFPFEFQVPATPRVYHGELLNVDLELTAKADIPWAIDPKTNAEIVVVYEDTTGYVVAPLSASDARDGCFPIAVATTVLAAAFALLLGIEHHVAVSFTLVLAVFSGLVAANRARRWFAAGKTGQVSVDVSQGGGGGYREVSDRSRVRCGVQIARRGVRINSIVAKLLVQEIVVKGSGTNRTTSVHELYSAEEPLSVEDNRTGADRLPLPEPSRIPFSFNKTDNHVEWRVNIHVDIEGWPDWIGAYTLDVTPGDSAG